jgi:hypothetical protein
MARLTAAQIATRLKGDNRTVVGSTTPVPPGGTKTTFVATDVGPVGITYGLSTASTSTAAAYTATVPNPVNAKITVPHGNGGLTKDDLRTQYFTQKASYDSTKVGFGAKRCFVNINGQPLAANGTPTTVALAIDADTTDLSALGEAVTNWAQCYKTDGTRTPVPGTYLATDRQTSLYAPYAGWTAQHDLV